MILSAFSSISWLAVVVAAVVGFVVAGVYFGMVIPKCYAKALGRENLPTTKPTFLLIFGPFVCNIVMIITTAVLMKMVGVNSLQAALSLGLLLGVGYLLAMCMTIALNPNFPKPFYYTLLNAPYFLMSILLTSFIIYQFG